MGFLEYTLLGLASGAGFAGLALAVVVAYRGSGVVNIAAGAMALQSAYWYVFLHEYGELVLPIGRFDVGRQSFLVSAGVALLLSALMGWLLYTLVFRPLRRAPTLAQVVASVGVMLGLQALVIVRFGSNAMQPADILPSGSFDVIGLSLPKAGVLFTGVVLLLAAAIWALYRYTSFGIASRASSENELATSLMGRSPTRIAATNWVIASVIGGIVGILLSPLSTLNPATLALAVVPALGAALLGRFALIWVTVAAGIGTGLVQSAALRLSVDWSWLPDQGLGDAVPFIVIVLALVVIGGRLPARGALVAGRLPAARAARHPIIGSVSWVVIGILAVVLLSDTYRSALITSVVMAIIAMSLVLLTGFVGQISLAQMTFAGVGGLLMGFLGTDVGLPFPVAPILASLAAAGVGVLIGLPALRVRGINLAIVTLGAAVAASRLIFDNPSIAAAGGVTIPDPSLFGLDLGIGNAATGGYPRVAFGVFVVVVAGVIALSLMALRRGATGRRFLAVRSNERAAAALGVSVERTKLYAFALSAFVASIGGCLLGYQQGVLSASSFDVTVSITVLAFAYIGGIGVISGSLIAGGLAGGGILALALDDWLGLGDYVVLVGAVALIVTAIANQDGVMGSAPRQLEQARDWLRLRRAGRKRPRPPHAPSIEQQG